MLFLIKLCILLNIISFFDSLNLRNLKISISPEVLKQLSSIGEDVLYKIYGLNEKKFDGQTKLEIKTNKHEISIIIGDDTEFPQSDDLTVFDVSNYKAINVPENNLPKDFYLLGKSYNIKEEFNWMTNTLSSSFKDGTCGIFSTKNKDDILIPKIKCIIVEKNEKIGSFQISQSDLNDGKSIWETIINFVKKYILGGKEITVVNLLSTVVGIKKDIKELLPTGYSSFLSVNYSLVIMLMAIFY